MDRTTETTTTYRTNTFFKNGYSTSSNVFLVKTTPSFFPQNPYAHSAVFHKCCMECCPNSAVQFEPKNKNTYFVDILNPTRVVFEAASAYSAASTSSSEKDELTNSTTIAKNDYLNHFKTKSLLDKLYPIAFRLATQRDVTLSCNHNNIDLEAIILSNERIKTLMGQELLKLEGGKQLSEKKQLLSSLKAKITKCIHQFRLNKIVSKRVLKSWLILFHSIVRFFVFEKILVYQPQLSSLRSVQNRHLPIIYVFSGIGTCNLHRRRLDQFILQLTLFLNNMRLSTPLEFFQSTSLSSGGSFTRRLLEAAFNFKFLPSMITKRCHSETIDSKITNQTILTYLTECLSNENDLSLSLDNDDDINNQVNKDMIKSSGYEFLKYIANLVSIEEDRLHDAVVVPVCVNYENMPELIKSSASSFSSSSSLLLKLVSVGAAFIWSCLCLTSSGNGKVRINFSQPFSLQEFCQSVSSSARSRADKSNRHRLDSNNNNDDNFSKNKELIVDFYLRKHIENDIFRTQSLMCTSIVAFVVVALSNFYHRQNGCSLDDLCNEFDRITKHLMTLKSCLKLGFSSQSTGRTIMYSLEILGKLVNVKRIKQQQQQKQQSIDTTSEAVKRKSHDLFISANQNRFGELFEMAKCVAQAYFLHSCVAHAIKAKLDFGDLNYTIISQQRTRVLLNENDLVFVASRLVRVFQSEFSSYKKPCESVIDNLTDCLSQFTSDNILVNTMANSFYVSHASKKRDADYDDWDDEPYQADSRDDETEWQFVGVESLDHLDPDTREIYMWKPFFSSKTYELVLNTPNFKTITSYLRILLPYIEGYFNVLSHLKRLLERDAEISYYSVDEIIDFVEKQISIQKSQSTINYIASTSKSMIHSALRYSLEINILRWTANQQSDDEQSQNKPTLLEFTKFSQQLLNENCAFLRKFL